jgi:NAD(P)-dependent dehydrogenase (short-subunit alcohol dehydrogenase family)
LALAREGAHVIAVARTTSQLEELDDRIKAIGGSATLVPLDLNDGAAIDRLGKAIHERWRKLDIFVGNAGVLGAMGPLTHIKPKIFEGLLKINVTANWRLMRSLDALLRASDAGRVIFVSSGAARKHKPYWGGYGMSKAALEHLALSYAAELADTPVRVNIINPGPTRTAMRAEAYPGENPKELPDPSEVAELFVELAGPDYTETAQTVDFKPKKR